MKYRTSELEMVMLTADIVSRLGKEIPSPHSRRVSWWTLVGASYRSATSTECLLCTEAAKMTFG